jgi:hypothetical protein
MRLDRAKEVVRSIGAQQLLGALDLSVEEPDGPYQQFGVSLRRLWG